MNFARLTFGSCEFVECESWCFHYSYKSHWWSKRLLRWMYFTSDISWVNYNIWLTPCVSSPHGSSWNVLEYSFGRIPWNLPWHTQQQDSLFLLPNLQNKFGWHQWFMFAHKLVPLTLMPVCIGPLGKNPIFPHNLSCNTSGFELAWLSSKTIELKMKIFSNLASRSRDAGVGLAGPHGAQRLRVQRRRVRKAAEDHRREAGGTRARSVPARGQKFRPHFSRGRLSGDYLPWVECKH